MLFRCLVVLYVLLTMAVSAEVIEIDPMKARIANQLIGAARAGDRVVFLEGQYRIHEPLTLNGLKEVTVSARGRVELVLDDLYAPVIQLDNCQKIRLVGLRARHAEPADEYRCEGAVIALKDCNQVTVRGCELNGCGAAGIYAMQVKHLLVKDNRIFNNSYAGLWFNSVSATILDNHIHDNEAALITWGANEIHMGGNRIENNRHGLFYPEFVEEELKQNR